MCLEFSKVKDFPLNEIYKAYNFNVVPFLGEFVAKDRSAYQYMV
jgi:demethylmenaquinone methyltransferase/2-methoxy-6-polyprenyl-1,4-benzoquinol methylase